MSARETKVDWRNHLPQNAGRDDLFQEFKEKAEALTVKVIRAKSSEDAQNAILAEMKDLKVKNASGTSEIDLLDINALKENASKEGITFSLETDREFIEKSQIGISQFDLGVAELGSIVQDANNVQKRLVSTLPPVHLALIPTKAIVETFADSLEVIQKTYNGKPSNFIAVVTGPSKTSDIERVLTIGVHGPGKLIVVCVD